MKCDGCGQKDAVIHIQQIMGSEILELHLCEACAHERGISSKEDKIELSLSSLLNGLIDDELSPKKVEEKKVCPRCEKKYSDFKQDGVLGCSDCYTVFRREISTLLNKMTGTSQHKGKYPKRLKTYKTFFIDREGLKHKLKIAIEHEEYEKAALLRDKIRELEQTVGEGDA